MRKKILSTAVVFVLLCVSATFCVGCDNEKAKNSTYEITAEFNGNTISGKEKCVFYNSTENVFTEIKFNLFANAFRKDAKFSPIDAQYFNQSYYGGASYGNITIEKVTDGEKELKYCLCGVDENILSVSTEKEIFPQESFTMFIDYKIVVANVIARTGINEKTINLANFYPILCGIEDGNFYECVYYAKGDPYYSDCADYTVTFSCDKKYVIASSGTSIKSTEADNIKTETFAIKKARSFAIVLSEFFKKETTAAAGVQINYYYYADNNPQESIKTAALAVEYFSQTFGKPAYDTLAVVQTKFVQGGMEFPSLVMISDALEERAYHEVIIHETAHEWWMAGVGNNEIEHAFMDEGLAEYSVVLFYEAHSDYGYTRKNLMNVSEKTYKTFCSVYDRFFGNVNTCMDRSLDKFKSEYEYVNIVYVKSCIMFDDLRTFMGDKKFFESVQNYYTTYLYKNAKPEDLIGTFEKNKREAASFMQGYLSDKVIIG